MGPTLDFLAHLRANSARFRDVLSAVDPTSEVPSCPGWDAAELLWHLSEVQDFWAAIVRDRLDHPEHADKRSRATDYEAQLAQFDACSASLIDALAAAPDDAAIWTWFPADQTVGFVRRRQAHEALIHRLDAELTAGAVTDFDPALATDGVLEVLEIMYSEVPPWANHQLAGPIGRVSTTDTGAEWLIRIGHWSGHSPDTGKTYEAEPTFGLASAGEPSFTISGTARDLDAWLWNRPTVTDVTREGDTSAFQAVIQDGIQ
ncbi:MAG TPA: maleylpyruvate isomerase family mycothiol-dependent enzyme [Jatrophihabitantaceae bacterium]|jgi:uncharacterized protein (TIGR03083 family)|nr:maleylpyruvate isomerase family mycothiol-dependent enzyme [Jatrophihabitantaceae bacterium]